MNRETFDPIIDKTLATARHLLLDKGAEYASQNDRLANFRRAASINNTTMSTALWGMYTKHLVSVLDMVEDAERLSKDDWARKWKNKIDEKILDSINYHLLLKAILIEQQT